jgi:NAD(P)H-dependent FMN reductase
MSVATASFQKKSGVQVVSAHDAAMASILVIAGSTRQGAFSKHLGRAACRLAETAGHRTSFVDLREFAMPLYDGDLESAQGLPDGAVRLRAAILASEAVLVVTPEYNASLPAVLKNALDWTSRPYAAEPGVSAWKNKVAALLATSPGALGGLRALVHLRQVLMNLGVLVLTEQFALGHADRAFAADGSLADPKQAAAVQAIVERLGQVAARLR